MLLKNKLAVIYGAGGAVAKTFVREGAPRSIGPVGGSNPSAPSRTRRQRPLYGAARQCGGYVRSYAGTASTSPIQRRTLG